jgi:hypothetical protein
MKRFEAEACHEPCFVADDFVDFAGLGTNSGESAPAGRPLAGAVDRRARDGALRLRPSHKFFSQQANILAILTNALPVPVPAGLLDRLMNDPSIARLQLHSRYYLGRAMSHAGLVDRYVDNLGPRERMIADGMTTFGEQDGNPRSECHLWSATPVYELLTTVAGFQPKPASRRCGPARRWTLCGMWRQPCRTRWG